MNYKKILSILITIAIIVGIISPISALATWNTSMGTLDPNGVYYLNDAYVEDTNRANTYFKLLGTSSSTTLSGPSALSSYSWDTTTNKYLWIGAYVSNMDRIDDFYNIVKFQTSLVYNKNYFTPVTDTTNLYSSFIKLNTDFNASNYKFDDCATVDLGGDEGYEYGDYKEKRLDDPNNEDYYMQSPDVPYDDSDYEDWGYYNNTLALNGSPVDYSGDASEHLVLTFCLEMTGASEPTALADVVQGFQHFTYTAMASQGDGSTKAALNLSWSRYTPFDMGDEWTSNYFNITNNEIKPATGYTITYKAPTTPAGGTVVTASETVSGGGKPTYATSSNITPPSGYKFKQWVIDGSSTVVDNTYTVNSNLDLVAEYEPIETIIEYDPGTGSWASGITSNIQEVFSPTTTATVNPTLQDGGAAISSKLVPPAGMVFKEWQVGGSAFTTSSTVTAGDTVTATAIYEAGKYTVTYNPTPSTATGITGQPTTGPFKFTSDNAATHTQTNVTGNTAVGTQATTELADVAVPFGYTINRWVDSTGATFDASTVVTADITVNAVYTALGTYTITLDLDGGTFSGKSGGTLTYNVYSGLKLDDDMVNGGTYTATEIAPVSGAGITKTNYTFSGWAPVAPTTGTYDPTTVYTGNVQFKATYTRNRVNLNYVDTKSTPTAETFTTQSILEAGSIDSTNTADSSSLTIPTPSNKPIGYKFKGWYTKTGGAAIAESDWTGKTEAQIDADTTLTQFTTTTTLSADTSVYAVYVLNDDKNLTGVTFYNPTFDTTPITPETVAVTPLAKGDPIPYTRKDGGTGKYEYLYPSTDIPTPAAAETFSSSVLEYYLLVPHGAEAVRAEFTLSDKYAKIEIFEDEKDSGGAPVTQVGTTSGLKEIAVTNKAFDVNTPDPVVADFADLPIDVVKDNIPTTVYARVTAYDGSSQTYKFNIVRLAKPEIVLAYGNTPAGLIYRDDEQFDTEAKKEEALNKFNASHSVNKKYAAGYVPIIKGSIAGGDAVYAQTAKAYTNYAWKRSYAKVNYDLNKYAYVVYLTDKFLDPGSKFVDEYGFETTTGITYDATLKRQKTSGPPSYTGNATKDKTEDITLSSLYNSTLGKYKFGTKMVRPDVYTENYVYTGYTPLGSLTAKTYNNSRPFIVISKYGDVYFTPGTGVNSLDSNRIKSATQINTGNSLLAFRIADVWMTPGPGVNSLDANELARNATQINVENFRFYPSIN